MKKRPYKKLYTPSPEQYIEYALCNLEKANNKIRSFHKNFQTYLATQRELILNEISQSLKKSGKTKKQGTFYRVVLSKYMNDPLCMAGSLLHSGRFHFGNISYDYNPSPVFMFPIIRMVQNLKNFQIQTILYYLLKKCH